MREVRILGDYLHSHVLRIMCDGALNLRPISCGDQGQCHTPPLLRP
jgi:hypothetical protein